MELEQTGGPDATNRNFIKSLKKVRSKVDSFQDKPLKQGSFRRHKQQVTSQSSTLNPQQQEHQRSLLNCINKDLPKDETISASLKLRSRLSHDQKDNIVTNTMFSRGFDQTLRQLRLSNERQREREKMRLRRESIHSNLEMNNQRKFNANESAYLSQQLSNRSFKSHGSRNRSYNSAFNSNNKLMFNYNKLRVGKMRGMAGRIREGQQYGRRNRSLTYSRFDE